MSELLEGIDISYWQGWPVNFGAIAASGKRFAIVRGGDGRFRDPRRRDYASGLASVGLRVDTYHFLRWAVPSLEMAAICRESYEQTQSAANQTGRLWLDEEDTNPIPPAPQAWDWLMDVVQRLDDLPLGNYTGPWWWDPRMPAQQPPGLRWLAVYPRNNSLTTDPTKQGLQPSIPRGWTGWDVWQYSSRGNVPGINALVALNVARPGVFATAEEEDMPLSNEDITKIVNAVRADRETDTGRVYVAIGTRVYILTEDQRLVHIPDPSIMTAQDPAWDVQTPAKDSPIWGLEAVYPAGVPQELRG